MDGFANMSWEEIRKLIEEKRRKQVQAFVMYGRINADAARERAKGEKELAELREKLDHWENYFSEMVKNSYAAAVKALKELDKAEENVTSFFVTGETPEEKAQREALMKQTNVDEKGFGHLAMAVCGKIKNGAKAAVSIFRGKKEPKEELERIRKEGKAKGEKALQAFADGEKAELEEMLREALVMGCYEFAQTKDPMDALMWARHVNGILGIVNSHETLLSGPEDAKLIEDAHGVGAMGKMLENGLEAVKGLQEAALNGEELSPEQKAELTSRVLLMQEVNGRRMSETMRKQCAKNYHPKKGLDPERMGELLDKMNRSDTVRHIANLNMENLVFSLGDGECRSGLTARMFREKEIQMLAPEPKAPENPVVSAPVK